MMKTKVFFVFGAVVLCLLFSGSLTIASETKDVPRMTGEQLKELLDQPDVIIIDVRLGLEVKAGQPKIKGAVRRKPKKVKEWAADLDRDKTYVLYCA